MSHFSVLVIHDENTSIDELLAPYDESIRGAPYQVFTRQEAISYVREHYRGFEKETDEACWKCLAESYKADSDGNLYDDFNPNSKWDWYEVGGRFENLLRLKDGKMTNSAKLRDIDFSLDEEEYKKGLRVWDIIVEHKPLEPDEKMPFSLYNGDYYHERYGSRENYAKSCAMFYTYAVVTPNGIWHEPDRMGWFGVSNATPAQEAEWEREFYKKFLENEKPEMVLTVVDCHV